MSSIVIQQSDGTNYDLDNLDLRVISFDVPSYAYNNTYQAIYADRPVLTQTNLNQGVISLILMIRAHDWKDYELQVLQLKKVFSSFQPFYVINTRVPYIRYHVVSEAFEIKRLDNSYYSQPITINLDMIDGCGESVNSTSNSTVDWGFGENAPNELVKYCFSNNQFNFWNLGNLPLKAESRPVVIKFNGSANNLQIINYTTAQTWQLNMQLQGNQTLVIDGIKPVYNSQNVFSATNHAYLDFAVGKNEMEIKGANGFTISFETRFYY